MTRIWIVIATFLFQKLPQGNAHEVENYRVDQTASNGYGLKGRQSFLSTGVQKCRGAGTLGQRPKDTLEDRRLRIAVGRETVDNQGSTVGTCNKVKDNCYERYDANEATEVFTILFDNVKEHLALFSARQSVQAVQRCRGVCSSQNGRTIDSPLGSIAFHSQARSSKDTEPQEAVKNRRSQASVDEVSDGPSTGNLSNEHADEGRPRNPPTPVENGPTVHPRWSFFAVWSVPQLCECVCVETKLNEILKVITDTLYVEIEEEPSVVVEQYEHHQKHTKTETDFAEVTNANLEARDNRESCNSGDCPNADDLVVRVLSDVAVDAV